MLLDGFFLNKKIGKRIDYANILSYYNHRTVQLPTENSGKGINAWKYADQSCFKIISAITCKLEFFSSHLMQLLIVSLTCAFVVLVFGSIEKHSSCDWNMDKHQFSDDFLLFAFNELLVMYLIGAAQALHNFLTLFIVACSSELTV